MHPGLNWKDVLGRTWQRAFHQGLDSVVSWALWMPLTTASIPWDAVHHVKSRAVESSRAPLPRLRWGGGGFVALIWHVLSGLFVQGCVLVAFNLIYVCGPTVAQRRWRWLMPGTLAGAMIWLLGSFGLKLYLSAFDKLTLSYGSVGAVIVLVMWLYLSGIAVLVGAEVNSIIENASA